MKDVKSGDRLWIVMRLRRWTELTVSGEKIPPEHVKNMPGIGFMSVHSDREEALAEYDDGRIVEIKIVDYNPEPEGDDAGDG